MDVNQLIGGVAAGIILAVAFLWCFRHLNAKEEDGHPPWWAILGCLGIIAFIGMSIIDPEKLPPHGQNEQASHLATHAPD